MRASELISQVWLRLAGAEGAEPNLPERLRGDPELVLRARNTSGISRIGLAVATALAGSFALLGPEHLPLRSAIFYALLACCVVLAALAAAAVPLLRRTGSPAIAISPALVFAFVAISLLTFSAGGLTSPIIWWLIAISPAASRAIGPRAGLLALCATLAVFTIYLSLYWRSRPDSCGNEKGAFFRWNETNHQDIAWEGDGRNAPWDKVPRNRELLSGK